MSALFESLAVAFGNQSILEEAYRQEQDYLMEEERGIREEEHRRLATHEEDEHILVPEDQYEWEEIHETAKHE